MIRKYKCDTCNTEFEIEMHNKYGKIRVGAQAKCPVCPNIMPTYVNKEEKKQWRS